MLSNRCTDDQCADKQSTHVMGAFRLQTKADLALPQFLIHLHDFVCSIFEMQLDFITGLTMAVLQITPDLVYLIAAVHNTL